MWSFPPSGWCFLQVQAQSIYLSLGPWLLPLGIWYPAFGPIECKQLLLECKQLLLDVSCVSVNSRCTTSHMASAYTLSFFWDEGEDSATPSESPWTLQLNCSRVAFSNPMYFAIFLYCTVTWIKCTTCRVCVWQSALLTSALTRTLQSIWTSTTTSASISTKPSSSTSTKTNRQVQNQVHVHLCACL